MRSSRRVAALVLLILGACTHRNDGSFSAAASSSFPVAAAGEDQKVLTLATITLDGSASRDPLGGTLTYLWEQIGGTGGTLTDADSAVATFTPATGDTLRFRLTVWNAVGSDTDEVQITVKSILVTADDQWFVGYGNSGNVTANVSGGTGPFTYEWAGVEPWLTVTTPTTTTDTPSTSNNLGYVAPTFESLQSLSDYLSVVVLGRAAMGRLQLKIKVTDWAGASDEDLVNFSVGPFPNSVMGPNVPLGEPVFVSGNSGFASWTWVATKPDGTAATFYTTSKAPLATTDQRTVYFVPNLPGRYQIVVTQSPTDVEAIEINCGTFVGVGTLLGKTPDSLKGECGGCHRGAFEWIADVQTPWEQTAHARAYSRLLDPSDALYAGSQAKGDWRDAFNFGSDFPINERTVGWSRISAESNEGWAERAEAEKYAFQGTSWAELKRKFPKTAEMSNVQCEVCHGPGSGHAGDTRGIAVSYEVSLCGRCHADERTVWENGAHNFFAVTEPATKASCNHCHTGRGFAIEMRSQVGATTYTALRSGANPARPPLPFGRITGVNCQGCHDPHRPSGLRTATGADPQLRAHGPVRLQSGVVTDFGSSALCALCHQSMVDSRVGSRDFLERRGPHSSVEAEILVGTGGMHFPGWTYDSSPHADPARFRAPGQTESRWCLACHWDPEPPRGTPEHGWLGGHTVRPRSGDWYYTAVCTQCHDPADIGSYWAFAARDDYDGNGSVETVQSEFFGLRSTLADLVPVKLSELVPGGAYWEPVNDDLGLLEYWDYAAGAPRTFPGPFSDNPDVDWSSLSDDLQKKWETVYMAQYNLMFAWEDRTRGTINTGYVINLLQSSIRALDPNAIPNARPYVPR